MARIVIAALLSCIALAARAEEMSQTTIVDCTAGAGCRCALPGVTANEIAIVLGEEAANPDAAKMILLSDALGSRWSHLTPDQADASYGGDGICPIEVFPPRVPRDGLWSGKVRTSTITGCPPQFDQMLPAMVGGIELSKHIAWDGRFHPSLLSDDPAHQPVTWEELSPEVYSGRLLTPAANEALKVQGQLSASLTSQDTAVAVLRLRLGMDGGAAQAILASAGLGDCRVTALYDFRRTGP